MCDSAERSQGLWNYRMFRGKTGAPENLCVLIRNLYTGQEASVVGELAGGRLVTKVNEITYYQHTYSICMETKK